MMRARWFEQPHLKKKKKGKKEDLAYTSTG